MSDGTLKFWIFYIFTLPRIIYLKKNSHLRRIENHDINQIQKFWATHTFINFILENDLNNEIYNQKL